MGSTFKLLEIFQEAFWGRYNIALRGITFFLIQPHTYGWLSCRPGI